MSTIMTCGAEFSPKEGDLGVCETTVETVYRVLPRHANPLGTLHGGRVMEWMVSTASLAAARFSRGPVVLGWLDNIFFLNPIKIGDNVIIRSWISLVGRSSMDLDVVVLAENVNGRPLITTIAHMAFVAVDDSLRPRPVSRKVIARNSLEEVLQEEAYTRRRERMNIIEKRIEERKNLEKPPTLWDEYSLAISRIAYPEDAIYANAMHAGKLLFVLDEVAGILASRYARGIVVTASVDSTAFYAPIRIGDIYNIFAAITYVGRSTIEVTLKVIVENPIDKRMEHTSTAYYTMVHIGDDLRPRRVPTRPIPAGREWIVAEAERRRRTRLERLKIIKKRMGLNKG